MKRVIASLLAALVALPSPAAAGCDAQSIYSFAFANQPAATLGYGSNYSYNAANGSGATRGFTMALAADGLTTTVVNGVQLPAIGTLVTGPDATKRDLVIGGTFSGRAADLSSGTRAITVTFTFAQPIRDLTLKVHDVDFGANQFRDWIQVTGSRGGSTYVPVLTSPWGQSNATGGTRTAANSSATLGASASPVPLNSSQAAGSGSAGNNSDTGTVTASFAQPVTSVTVRYANAPLTTGELVTGQQAAGIEGISFCPMPELSVAKTSAPLAGALGAYALPGQDMSYTFTVTNTGASPVDPGTIVLTDVLPAGLTFRNQVLDTASGTPFLLAPGSSGLSLPASGIGYSANGGSSYVYAPAAGYDPTVNAVRVTPVGTMAAQSSFTVTFVARVK